MLARLPAYRDKKSGLPFAVYVFCGRGRGREGIPLGVLSHFHRGLRSSAWRNAHIRSDQIHIHIHIHIIRCRFFVWYEVILFAMSCLSSCLCLFLSRCVCVRACVCLCVCRAQRRVEVESACTAASPRTAASQNETAWNDMK